MIFVKQYLKRWAGSSESLKLPPRPSLVVLTSSFLGAFLGISLVCGVSTLLTAGLDEPVILGSIGAMAVLIYGAIDAPLSQPRNLVFGNLMSALLGVIIQEIFTEITGNAGSLLWLKAGLAVGSALVVMQLTQTVHPPAGATALIAVTGGKKIFDSRYYYLVVPVALNVFILLLVALAVNNVKRQYPKYWWNPETNFTVSSLNPSEKVASQTVTERDIEMDIGGAAASVSGQTTDELKQRIEFLEKRIQILESNHTTI